MSHFHLRCYFPNFFLEEYDVPCTYLPDDPQFSEFLQGWEWYSRYLPVVGHLVENREEHIMLCRRRHLPCTEQDSTGTLPLQYCIKEEEESFGSFNANPGDSHHIPIFRLFLTTKFRLLTNTKVKDEIYLLGALCRPCQCPQWRWIRPSL